MTDELKPCLHPRVSYKRQVGINGYWSCDSCNELFVVWKERDVLRTQLADAVRTLQIADAALKRVHPQARGILVVQDIAYAIERIGAQGVGES